MTSGLGSRQRDLNFEADRMGVRCDDCAAVLTNGLESDRQSKARAVVCPWISVWFLYTEERLEDLLQQLFGDTGTVIADRKNGLRGRAHSLGFQNYVHFTSWRGEPNCVANDILTCAAQGLLTGLLDNYASFGLQPHRLATRASLDIAVSHHFLNQLREVHTV